MPLKCVFLLLLFHTGERNASKASGEHASGGCAQVIPGRVCVARPVRGIRARAQPVSPAACMATLLGYLLTGRQQRTTPDNPSDRAKEGSETLYHPTKVQSSTHCCIYLLTLQDNADQARLLSMKLRLPRRRSSALAVTAAWYSP